MSASLTREARSQLCSLNGVQFLHHHHECAHTHGVSTSGSVRLVLHVFLGSVVHSVELSDLVDQANALENCLDFISGPWQLEIVL